jgi:hypothetical protein
MYDAEARRGIKEVVVGDNLGSAGKEVKWQREELGCALWGGLLWLQPASVRAGVDV